MSKLSEYLYYKFNINEILRSKMPQIKGNNILDAIKILDKYGIPYKYVAINIDNLKPVQQNIIPDKINNICKDIESGKKMNPIFISMDNNIIDGHHRWLAFKKLNKQTINTIKLGLDKEDALRLFNKIQQVVTENQRYCPNCNKLLTYVGKRSKARADKNNAMCLKCSQVGKHTGKNNSMYGKYGVDNPLYGRERNDIKGDKNLFHKNEIKKKIKETNYLRGYWNRSENKSAFRNYLEKVRTITTENYSKYFYDISNAKKRSDEYHLDHKYSIHSGFKNNISPEIIAHYKNLEILHHRLNESKGNKNSITLEQLMLDIKNSKNPLNENKIKNIVVVMSGRFQPFHSGHYFSYQDLINKFGKNVYITTSNVTDDEKSPFNFNDKKEIITKMFGIPSNKVIRVKNPYKPEEILDKFNSKDTALVAAVGEKDRNRLSGKYYVPYTSKENLEGYLDKGYVYIVPQLKLKIGGTTISGSSIRNNFSKELFKQIYPKFDSSIYQLMKKKITESLLLEGGSYGHIDNIFEDMGLTFGDLKNIINLALEGKLEMVQEKTDGMNAMFSWIDGKLKVARNASHLKNFGRNALDISGLQNMFSGRGDIQIAFTEAMRDLNSAISKLSDKQKNKIFANGKKFMSVEIIYPQTTNVVPYNYSMLIFHGTREYDENGNILGEDKSEATLLTNMIRQVNEDVQNTFKIRAPNNLSLPKVKNFTSQKSHFLSKLGTLQKKFNLKDSDSITQYHQVWWENFINQQAKKLKYTIPNDLFMDLVKRWAYNDTSKKIVDIKKRIDDDSFKSWVDNFDKNSKSQQAKDNMRPFELLFLELGAQVLKNINSFLAVNPEQSLQQMKTNIDKTIKDIESSGDVNAINKMKTELNRLNAMGGLDAVVPSEGITFMYGQDNNKKLYKITGAFSPINQLLGILKYKR